MEGFILELGAGFSFVARQKRITIDNEDYHIDLLLFNRILRRLVAIELKLGKFRAADKGQMELYLRWLAKNEMKPGEEQPAGLILCAEASKDHIEYMELNKGEIRVASYLTKLPQKALLEQKLHEAIVRGRERVEIQIEAGLRIGTNVKFEITRNIDRLKAGVENWNTWRKENPGVRPGLRWTDLSTVNISGADFAGIDFLGTHLYGADICNVKSFYRAKLDRRILSEIKTRWPEKLATIFDATKNDWVIDTALLERIKRPDWHGWAEEEKRGK